MSAHSYIQLAGPLFESVQAGHVFKDSKTFVDTVPQEDASAIEKAFEEQRTNKGFALTEFVRDHFWIPPHDRFLDPEVEQTLKGLSMEQYVRSIWPLLMRDTDKAVSGSTLLPLPRPYVVPGGRFREIYYWDSYFTSLGLLHAGLSQSVVDMCRNFAYLIDTYGHVPNGNRYYYLSRSQPPYFSLMIELVERAVSSHLVYRFLAPLRKEYEYWMNGPKAVGMDDGSVANRYYDTRNTPREEGFADDMRVFEQAPQDMRPELYRNLRAGAESGWDFSSRWFADGRHIGTIHTTDIVPVDLNCLMYGMEQNLARWTDMYYGPGRGAIYVQAAESRKRMIQTYLWSEADGIYYDFDLHSGKQTPVRSLAAVFPLFAGIATKEQGKRIAAAIKRDFLHDGGLVTTLSGTGEQWDYPVGWAPLQWIAVKGLERYGYRELASEVRNRWIGLNRRIFDMTGYMFEKYDVVNTQISSDLGEYPVQIGFGWTNGVLLDFLSQIT